MKKTKGFTNSLVWRDLLVVGRIRSSSGVLDMFGRGCINGNNTNKTVQEVSQKTEATKTLLQCRDPGKEEDESHGPEERR